MKRAFKKILPVLVIGATTYYFINALMRNWENVSEISFRPDAYSLIAFILFVLAVIVSGLLWGMVLNHISLSTKISIRNSIRIYSASWLLKYMPGQAGSYLNKVAWGVKNGFSKKTMTLSFLYENVLLFFASILPTVPFVLLLFLDDIGDNYTLFLPLLIAIPFIVVMNKKIFHGIVNFLSQKLRKKEIDSTPFISTKRLALIQLWYVLPRIITGAGFVLIAKSLLNITPEMYVPLAAIYVLAGIVGILAIFVPSGIGVREAVIVLLASAYFSIEEAIVLSIIARFYATVADLGVLGVYLYLNNWRLTQQ